MNAMEKVRLALKAHEFALADEAKAIALLNDCRKIVESTAKEVVRVIGNTYPGRQVVFGRTRYEVADGQLVAWPCDDVIIQE